MKHAVKLAFAAVIASMICALHPAHAIVLPKTARILPTHTVLLIDVDNFSRLQTQFEKTNLYKLYKDPAMTPFIDDAKAKLRKKVQQLDENNIYRAFYNADVLPQGRFALALALDRQADINNPPALIIAQWGQKIDKIKEAVSKLLEKNVEMGGHQKKSEPYRSVNIETIIDEADATLHYSFLDDCFIITPNLDLLKFTIAHITGATSPTLYDDPDYTSTTPAVGPYHDLDLYVNIKQIIKTATAKDPDGNAATTIANLGVDNVASAALAVGLQRRPGTSLAAKALLKVNGEKKGVCKMLDVESAPIRPPRFIPASVCSASFLNLNIPKLYTELGNILTRFSPQAAAWMYMPLPTSDSPDQPGLKIKDDIIDHLGSQIIIAQSVNKPFEQNRVPTETLFALAANNPKALEKSLALIHSKFIATNDPDAKRELLGHTIYLISMAALPFLAPQVQPMQQPDTTQAQQIPNLAFTFTDTHLIFGVESTVEQTVRILASQQATEMTSQKWFNAAKAAIEPSLVGLAALEDTAASSEFFWWTVKQAAKKQRQDSTLSTGLSADSVSPFPHLIFSQAGEDAFNFSLLPEFDTVRKYFGLSAFYGLSRADGFFFELNYLRPAGTD